MYYSYLSVLEHPILSSLVNNFLCFAKRPRWLQDKRVELMVNPAEDVSLTNDTPAAVHETGPREM